MVVLLLMKEKEIFLPVPGMLLCANLRRLTVVGAIDFQNLKQKLSNVAVTLIKFKFKR